MCRGGKRFVMIVDEPIPALLVSIANLSVSIVLAPSAVPRSAIRLRLRGTTPLLDFLCLWIVSSSSSDFHRATNRSMEEESKSRVNKCAAY